MKLIADARIELPFKIDLCACGPDVEPLTCTLNGFHATLFFPPSLGEGTDGQGIFGDWAWWTGRSLRLTLEREIERVGDVESLRETARAAGTEILRRFLNAYRWRLGQPAVHPVAIDPRCLTLEAVHDDGRREALAEPIASFFYQNMPKEPPLETSVNAGTLSALQADVQAGREPPMTEKLRLDAESLESQGETDRAALVRGLIQKEQEESR